MDALIPVSNSVIAGQSVQTVNARDLHSYLNCGTAFNHWINRRIDDFGFAQDVDFTVSFLTIDQGGSGRREFHISFDMAKELAMLERSDKGRQVRQYFIECERRLLALKAAPAPSVDLGDAAALRGLLLGYTERVIALEAKVEEQRPAVEFVDRYVQAGGEKGFREVCKLLKANEARFREFLLGDRIMYVLGGKLMPYQNHIDASRFVVKTGVSDANGRAFTQAKLTTKGIEFVAGRWAAWQSQEAS